MMSRWSKSVKFVCLLLCGGFTFLTTSARAKPTLTFQLPPALTNLPPFVGISRFVERKMLNDQMKTYTGVRQTNDSLVMIYHHDLTIAIVELGPEKSLLGCELIEINNDDEGAKVLKELATVNIPLQIDFREMVKLMKQCEKIDYMRKVKRQGAPESDQTTNRQHQTGYFTGATEGLSILSGILPGTKWCGTGDIAKTYHDLGTEATMDMCCRTHDLCPVKVRAYQQRYNLTNKSIYTKSHCKCDDMLFNCLKRTNTSASQFMGTIYFNVVQVPCVLDTERGYRFRKARTFS
uniref:Phospholipase A2 n=1 Tax=Phlebotomus kandelakii TaxID=1109342 RepID=A0A6B2EKB4_9DIPT